MFDNVKFTLMLLAEDILKKLNERDCGSIKDGEKLTMIGNTFNGRKVSIKIEIEFWDNK